VGYPRVASESEERLDLIPDRQADQDGCKQEQKEEHGKPAPRALSFEFVLDPRTPLGALDSQVPLDSRRGSDLLGTLGPSRGWGGHDA
jgi:hypothetical protein